MSIFSMLKQDLAIDLGTSNTVIIHNDKVVIDEPSVIAIERNTGKMIAVGRQAMQMHGKTHENIKTIYPLKDGVISDFHAVELMLRGLIRMIDPTRKFFAPSLRMMICIPSGITEVETRAVRDSAEHAGGKEIFLIHEPMAAALGIGIDVSEPIGNMIIDIGGGTSEIAIIALGGIVCDRSVRIAGDGLTSDIEEYMRKQHNILIGERTAERIKIEAGSALFGIEHPPPDFAVHGRDLMTGIPKEIYVSTEEIARSLDKSLLKIEEAVLHALEITPPELAADIYRTGIHLTGGGALLRGLNKRISLKTKLPVHIADDPLRAVVRGTGIALKNIDRFPFLMK